MGQHQNTCITAYKYIHVGCIYFHMMNNKKGLQFCILEPRVKIYLMCVCIQGCLHLYNVCFCHGKHFVLMSIQCSRNVEINRCIKCSIDRCLFRHLSHTRICHIRASRTSVKWWREAKHKSE